MPRPDPFTPRRRLLMKVILWVVFGGTMGLAGLVTHQQSKSRRVELSQQPIDVQGLSIKLPAKFKQRAAQQQDTSIIVEAAESGSGRNRRILTVYRERLDSPMSPFEYLMRRFDVNTAPQEEFVEATFTHGTRFGSYPGIITFEFSAIPGNSGEPPQRTTYAAAVLPSGRAITIKLQARGKIDTSDSVLVDQVARNLTISDEPPLGTAGKRITLAGGIELTPPSPFRPVLGADPNRTSRRLWQEVPDPDNSALQWASVELVPFIILSPRQLSEQETDLETELRTALLAFDPRWRGTELKRVADDEFQASDPEEVPEQIVSTRAFIRTSPSGRALLTVVRAPAADVSAYWNQLRSTVRLDDSAQLDEMIRLGAAEVARLRELPLDQLLAQREDEWHLYVNQSRSPHLGWSHIEWTPGSITAEVQTRLRASGGLYVRGTNKWNASADWNRHRSDLELVQSTRSTAPKQTTCRIDVRGDSVSLWATREGKNLEQWKRIAPANYIPGSILPHLIGKLSLSDGSAMLLKTDSFPTSWTVAPEGLFTLIVRPAENATTQPESKRSRDSRTVSIEINGSGELTQWRFADDGTLESIKHPNSIERV
jgi:hypothetical protein